MIVLNNYFTLFVMFFLIQFPAGTVAHTNEHSIPDTMATL